MAYPNPFLTNSVHLQTEVERAASWICIKVKKSDTNRYLNRYIQKFFACRSSMRNVWVHTRFVANAFHTQMCVLIFHELQKNLTGKRSVIFGWLSSSTVPLTLNSYHLFSVRHPHYLTSAFWPIPHICTRTTTCKNNAIGTMKRLQKLTRVGHIGKYCLRYILL